MVLSLMKRVLGGSQVEYYVVPPSHISPDLYLSLVDLYHAFQRLLTTFFKKGGQARELNFNCIVMLCWRNLCLKRIRWFHWTFGFRQTRRLF